MLKQIAAAHLLLLTLSVASIGADDSTHLAQSEESAVSGGAVSGTIKARGMRDARDVIIYLEEVEGEFQPPKEKPVIDQKNLVFVPHVTPILVGTTVQFINSDDVKHNIFCPSKSMKFNLGTYSKGVTREVTFDNLGKASLLCNVHAEMSAFVFVLQNPYYALTGPDGAFIICNIPPGSYTVKTWHDKLKEQEQEVIVVPGEATTISFKLSR